MDTIRIRGARTHNLKNLDLDLPRDVDGFVAMLARDLSARLHGRDRACGCGSVQVAHDRIARR